MVPGKPMKWFLVNMESQRPWVRGQEWTVVYTEREVDVEVDGFALGMEVTAQKNYNCHPEIYQRGLGIQHLFLAPVRPLPGERLTRRFRANPLTDSIRQLANSQMVYIFRWLVLVFWSR